MQAANFQPRCSIIFTTFAGEEVGQIGSETYAQQAIADSLDIRLVINLDMIGNNIDPHTLLKILRYDGSLGHAANAAVITTQYTSLGTQWGYHNYNGTDSFAFWNQGFSTLTISEYDYSPWWHSDEDITAHIDADYCAEVVKAVTALAAVYATMPLPPASLEVRDIGSGTDLLAIWDIPPDPLVSYYNVYCGTREDSLAFWNSTAYPSCRITGLTEGRQYTVAVSSVDLAGNEGYQVLGRGIPRSMPQPPEFISAQPLPNAIRLDWAPNVEFDLVGYDLYRSLDPAHPGACIARIDEPITTYTDDGLLGSLDYYCYRLRAIDSQGIASPFSEQVRSRPVTMDQGILVIDETRDYGGATPFLPTDVQVDEFYAGLLEDFAAPAHLDLATEPAVPGLADLGPFSSVLWHGNDAADLSYPALAREALRQYIALGGQVLFSVYFPSNAFEYCGGYPSTFGPDTFINDVLGISGVDFNSDARFQTAVPAFASWPLLEVDSLKTVTAMNGHIFRVEGLTPSDTGTAVYFYGSAYPDDSPAGSLNGQGVGVLHSYGEGQTLTLSFPLYHMELSGSKTMAAYVFGSLFGESSPVEDDTAPSLVGPLIFSNHPNPFSSQTSISFRLPVPGAASLKIYNLKGQLVRILLDDTLVSGAGSVDWDGLDASGRRVASGVYLVRLTQSGRSGVRKIVVAK